MSAKKRKTKKISNRVANGIVIFVVTVSFAIIAYHFIKKHQNPTNFNEDKYTVRGVDLSHHNPIIDWKEVRDKNNISFVYLKATGGVNHSDRNYPYNYKSATKNNVKVGSYHFYLFGISGERQAKHFIKTMKYVSGDLYPAIDVEHSKDNPYSKDPDYKKLVIKELMVLENELYEYYGVHPLIYTNKECYKLYINNNFPENKIWMCDLNKEPTDIPNWVVWQFSHTGKLDGIVGDIDLNYFRYPYDQLSKITLP